MIHLHCVVKRYQLKYLSIGRRHRHNRNPITSKVFKRSPNLLSGSRRAVAAVSMVLLKCFVSVGLPSNMQVMMEAINAYKIYVFEYVFHVNKSV